MASEHYKKLAHHFLNFGNQNTPSVIIEKLLNSSEIFVALYLKNRQSGDVFWCIYFSKITMSLAAFLHPLLDIGLPTYFPIYSILHELFCANCCLLLVECHFSIASIVFLCFSCLFYDSARLFCRAKSPPSFISKYLRLEGDLSKMVMSIVFCVFLSLFIDWIVRFIVLIP